jgi:hypothetical protein
MSRLRGGHLRRLRFVFLTVPFCHASPGRVSHSDVPRGTGGVAKPRLGSDLGLEMRPTDKLGSTIKSDGPAGGEGEVFDRLYNLSPLGRFVSQIACRAVNGQIATMRDIIGAEQDTDITVEFGFSASSGATWSPDDTVGR